MSEQDPIKAKTRRKARRLSGEMIYSCDTSPNILAFNHDSSPSRRAENTFSADQISRLHQLPSGMKENEEVAPIPFYKIVLSENNEPSVHSTSESTDSLDREYRDGEVDLTSSEEEKIDKQQLQEDENKNEKTCSDPKPEDGKNQAEPRKREESKKKDERKKRDEPRRKDDKKRDSDKKSSSRRVKTLAKSPTPDSKLWDRGDAASELNKQKKYADFCQNFPQWLLTTHMEKIIEREYAPRLGDVVYLDYTGASIYSKTQIERHSKDLLESLYGNPHSINHSSENSSLIDAQARLDILEYFRADPKEYALIFTNNASGACKLIAESFPFGPKKSLTLLNDNHNSLVGMREYATRAKAEFVVINTNTSTGLITESELLDQLGAGLKSSKKIPPGLFCYPAQSNWSSVQHPLEYIEILQKHGWKVLLDAAAFVPTNRLDLSKCKPDYVPISLYKMLGYPTGIGCLIAKKESLKCLTRPWFAGGTVTAVSIYSKLYGHYKNDDFRYWEDGTPNFLATKAVSIGLEFFKTIGVETIHTRVVCLAEWVMNEAKKLVYPNGVPLVQIYGTTDMTKRGGSLAFNLVDWKRRSLPYELVDQQAIKWKLCLRTGCFCNPGASERLLGFKSAPFVICLAARSLNGSISAKDIIVCGNGHALGAVRASFGIASRWEDAYRLIQFLESFLNIDALRIFIRDYKAKYKIPESLC